MRFGAHLPLLDFGDGCATVGELRAYARVAAALGYDTVSANDHLVWRRPWLDGLTALAAVAGCADVTLATTVALPVVRGPAVLAKALATLAALHAGPVIAGVGPGSSVADHRAASVAFEQRWPRFDAAMRILRELFRGADLPGSPGSCIAPLPDPAPQLWVGSWGSAARLRALAAGADGWFASGYNTTPSRYAATRARLDAELVAAGRDPATFPDTIATMWFYVTHDRHEATAVVEELLAPALDRDPRTLAEHLPIGPPTRCAEILFAYAEAGAQRVLLWPVRDGIRQLQACAEQVLPHLADGRAQDP